MSKSDRDAAVVQAIYDGIRDIFPVDLLVSMGKDRANQYMALWANAAANRLLKGELLVSPEEHAQAAEMLRIVATNRRLSGLPPQTSEVTGQ